MMVITYIAFIILGSICAGLQYWAIKSRKDPSIGNNPNFLQFQRGYFAAYYLALLADWLQGPYLYKLYSHYGFQEDQIAVLYVCGFASTVLLGTWAPIAADRFGRRKLCIFFTIVYSLACFFKLSRNYGILILGRILGGISTSLLFYAFEAWYVHEHVESNDFPKEWVPVTFSKANVWNGALAIVAGFVANIFAEWLGFGPVSPFMLAVPCLVVSGIIVMVQWPENYGKQQFKFGKSCMDGLQEIVTEPRIFLIGIIQSLFESVIYIFVFLWTPVLAPGKPSLGIVFSSFMVCIMIGSAIFQLLRSRHFSVSYLLTVSIALALVSNILCVLSTHPDNVNRNLAFIAFLLFEVSVGIYFPVMGFIRSHIIPEANHTSIMNWFRVPMNLIACIVLMLLHNENFRHGNRLIFVVCTGLLALAVVSVVKFVNLIGDEELKFDQNTQENGQMPNSA